MIIAIWHFNYVPNGMIYGFAPVEFFFILSGVFMYKSLVKKDLSVVDYSIGRFKKFAVEIYLMLFFLILLRSRGLFMNHTLSESLQHLLWEVLLFNQVLPYHDSISFFNTPTWFFGVLLYGGAIVYAILKIKNIGIKLLLPLIFIGYSILLNSSSSLENFASGMGMIRGVCDLSVGVLLGYYIVNKPISHSSLLDIVSISALFLSVILIFLNNVSGILFVVCYCVVIISCFDRQSFFNKLFNCSFWDKLGTLSLYIFITHSFVKRIWHYVNLQFSPSDAVMFSGYIISVVLFAYVYQIVCVKIKNTKLFGRLIA